MEKHLWKKKLGLHNTIYNAMHHKMGNKDSPWLLIKIKDSVARVPSTFLDRNKIFLNKPKLLLVSWIIPSPNIGGYHGLLFSLMLLSYKVFIVLKAQLVLASPHLLLFHVLYKMVDNTYQSLFRLRSLIIHIIHDLKGLKRGNIVKIIIIIIKKKYLIIFKKLFESYNIIIIS